MSTDDAKRTRIKAKVAASQARQKRAGPSARPRPAPKDDLPEDYRSLARQYPWLIVGGGVAAGVLVAALLPRGIGRRWGKRAMAAAAVGSEVALAFGARARDAAAEAGRDGIERLEEFGGTVGEGTAEMRERATKAGGAAVRQARDTGLSLARGAVKLAARVRR